MRLQIEKYGPGHTALKRKVDAERRWTKQPLGPIGLHLEIRDAEWVDAVESQVPHLPFTFPYHDLLTCSLTRRLRSF